MSSKNEVEIVTLDDRNWYSTNGVHCCGNAFVDGELLNPEKLVSKFDNLDTVADFEAILQSLNGYFSIIIEHQDRILVGSDHIRSIPVFYTRDKNAILVGDDYRTILEKSGHSTMDRGSLTEFLLSGYPSGANTLHTHISKVRPAQIVEIPYDRRKQIAVTDYITYPSKRDSNIPVDFPDYQADEVLSNVVHRLLRYADGRPIIVPLTGGYDSRLIALALLKEGYDDFYTVCHNLGTKSDIEISKSVAKEMGVSWESIRLTHNDVKTFFDSDIREKLYWQTGAYGRLSPSVWLPPYLEKIELSNELPDSGVIVQGHHAGAPGVFVSPWIYNKSPPTSGKAIIESLLDYHYNRYRWHRSGDVRRLVEDRITDVLPFSDTNSRKEAISMLEEWYWKERTPNFLVSDELVYQQFGFDRWLPLWDREYMDFMFNLPIDLRYDKRFHKQYTDQLYTNLVGGQQGVNSDSQSPGSLQTTITAHLVDTPIRKVMNWGSSTTESLSKRINWEKEYETNPQWGFLSKDEFQNCFTGRERYRHLLAAKSIEKYWCKSVDTPIIDIQTS